MNTLGSEYLLNSIHSGANEVIQNKIYLNKINVFPVNDCDTGTNLSSAMQSILYHSKKKPSVRDTFKTIADAALYGARGNSGIIFAQYMSGLSQGLHNTSSITLQNYAYANKTAANAARQALQNPVEGTILTVMDAWSEALVIESEKEADFSTIITYAIHAAEKALENTKNQLTILKKANVVDSGAQGFLFFLHGIHDFVKNGVLNLPKISNEYSDIELDFHLENTKSPYRYCTEAMLYDVQASSAQMRKELSKYGDSLAVATNPPLVRTHIHTNTPGLVYSYLNRIGTISAQKVDDMLRQHASATHPLARIAIVTDSVADIPQQYLDKYQIHVLNLTLTLNETTYLDRLTIDNKKLLETIKTQTQTVSSSQPNPMQIDRLFQFLSSNYESAIILTVSSALSGTYNTFVNRARQFSNKSFKIDVIDTKANSGAQGLLVIEAAREAVCGASHTDILHHIQTRIPSTHIYVYIKSIDAMIRNGRIHGFKGHIAKRLKIKPLVTLDHEGRGKLTGFSLHNNSNYNRLIHAIKEHTKKYAIEKCMISHVNAPNEALKLSEILNKNLDTPVEIISETSSIVALSAGEGALAVSFITCEDKHTV
jgi:hypothetical protein